MIDYGNGMIFPDSWAFGQPPGYEIETVSCPVCGEDRWPDEPCEHCTSWPEQSYKSVHRGSEDEGE